MNLQIIQKKTYVDYTENGPVINYAEGRGIATKCYWKVSAKGRYKQFYSVLSTGEVQKVLDPRFSHFVSPPPRNK